MGEKDRHQSMALEILRPDDTTLWKQALKSELGRRAKGRLRCGRRARPRLLTMIWHRLQRPR
jgi:hypothetical protein